MERFRSRHVVATVLAENVPQIALQYYFMFGLGLATNIVIISFVTSIFNILQAIMSVVVFYILYRNQVDIPFTITILWKKTARTLGAGTNDKELSPFSRCGRRSKLAQLLGRIDLGDAESLKFEVLTSTKLTSGCLLYCTMRSTQDAAVQVVGGKFDDFTARKQAIDDAVMRAFGFGPEYLCRFAFNIAVTRSTASSLEQRVKWTIATLIECKIPEDAISAIQRQMDSVLEAQRVMFICSVRRKMMDLCSLHIVIGTEHRGAEKCGAAGIGGGEHIESDGRWFVDDGKWCR